MGSASMVASGFACGTQCVAAGRYTHPGALLRRIMGDMSALQRLLPFGSHIRAYGVSHQTAIDSYDRYRVSKTGLAGTKAIQPRGQRLNQQLAVECLLLEVSN